jgi:hypothetical protein
VSARSWWQVTYRGTAEMVVWVHAETRQDAFTAAEDGDYEEASPVEFVRGRPYTMKAQLAPDYTPGDAP